MKGGGGDGVEGVGRGGGWRVEVGIGVSGVEGGRWSCGVEVGVEVGHVLLSSCCLASQPVCDQP